jgi:hypothetical protein
LRNRFAFSINQKGRNSSIFSTWKVFVAATGAAYVYWLLVSGKALRVGLELPNHMAGLGRFCRISAFDLRGGIHFPSKNIAGYVHRVCGAAIARADCRLLVER